jgi:hypothetical protein
MIPWRETTEPRLAHHDPGQVKGRSLREAQDFGFRATKGKGGQNTASIPFFLGNEAAALWLVCCQGTRMIQAACVILSKLLELPELLLLLTLSSYFLNSLM